MSEKKSYQLTTGAKIGPYEILEPLGQGGMGEVYKAYEPSLHRSVALKILSRDISQNKDFIKRFHSEARVLAKINHPNVVTVHSLGNAEGLEYMAMEFVDGRSVLDVIKEKKRIEVEEALAMFSQMLAGVSVLHRNGIIHRDLKPGNIIQCRDGSIKIVDLGIAKDLQGTNPDLTAVGEFIGSPRYMAPEQAVGDPPSIQTDIWALGLILYEMLTGLPAFQGKNKLDILKKVRTQPLVFPAGEKARLPTAVVEIVSRMAASDPAVRYKGISEVEEDLRLYFLSTPNAKRPRLPVESLPRQALSVTSPTNPSSIQQSALDSDSMPTFDRTSRTRRHKRKRIPMAIPLLGLFAITLIIYFLLNPLIVAPLQIVLNSPSADGWVWLGTEPLVFEWQVQGKQKFPLRLQISSSPQFSEILLDEENPNPPLTITTPSFGEGSYYWRIVTKNNNDQWESLTKASRFHLGTTSAPELVSPPNKKTFLETTKNNDPQLGQDTTSVALAWKQKNGVTEYHIQIAGNSDFTTPLFEFNTKESTLKTPPLTSGTYYWRVSSHVPNKAQGAWSEGFEFKLLFERAPGPNLVSAQQLPTPPAAETTPSKPPAADPPLQRPTMSLKAPLIDGKNSSHILRLAPGTTERMIASDLKKQGTLPQLTWSRVEAATYYEISFSENAEFQSLLETYKVKTNAFTWSNPKLGTYFWRVRAFKDNNNGSPFSGSAQISLQLPPPELSPIAGPTATPELQWNQIPGASQYLVQVSGTKDFASLAETQKVNRNVASLKITQPGTYFARVSVLDEKGKQQSSFSKVGKFQIGKLALLSIPKIITPLIGTEIEKVRGAPAIIRFTWSKVKGAQNYQLQFSLDSEFSNVFHSERSTISSFTLNKKFPKGRIYWRLRAENPTGTSPWTKIQYFELPD